jgi:hypothetical protein
MASKTISAMTVRWRKEAAVGRLVVAWDVRVMVFRLFGVTRWSVCVITDAADAVTYAVC